MHYYTIMIPSSRLDHNGGKSPQISSSGLIGETPSCPMHHSSFAASAPPAETTSTKAAWITCGRVGRWKWVNHDLINGHFRNPKWRYLPYIRPMMAYVRGYPHRIWPHSLIVPYIMVQYLHFRILKWPLT